MAIVATDSGGGGDFSPMPAGNHMAVCNMVVDLGKQRTVSQMYGEKIKHQVYIRWETPHERIIWTDRDGKEQEGPRVIGKTYTLSLHENAALRADLESWRAKAFTEEEKKGFDVSKLLGVPCMVNVIHQEKNGKNYANVSSVGAFPKGMDRPSTQIGILLFDDDNRNNYDLLPEWLQKKVDEQIKDSPKSSGFNDDLDDDEIPF